MHQEQRQKPGRSFIGTATGWLLSTWPVRMKRPTGKDFERMEFKSSTQRMGVRFVEAMRDIFRLRWLRRIGGHDTTTEDRRDSDRERANSSNRRR